MRDFGDVACPQKQHRIARLHRRAHRGAQVIQRADEFHRLALRAHGAGQQRPVHARNLRLARGINFREPELVRAGETSREFAQQMLRARVAVRLERHEQAARTEAFQRFQSRGNFVRVMTVIVEQAETRIRKKFLLSARRAAEECDAFGNIQRLKTEPVQQRNDRRAVGNVFVAQQARGEFTQALTVVPDFKASHGLSVAGWCWRGFRFCFDAVRRERMETIRNGPWPLGK